MLEAHRAVRARISTRLGPYPGTKSSNLGRTQISRPGGGEARPPILLHTRVRQMTEVIVPRCADTWTVSEGVPGYASSSEWKRLLVPCSSAGTYLTVCRVAQYPHLSRAIGPQSHRLPGSRRPLRAGVQLPRAARLSRVQGPPSLARQGSNLTV